MTDNSNKSDLSVPTIPDGPLFSELAGMDEARRWGEALTEDIKLYLDGQLAWDDIDAGIVVHGPPGTGKTTFARALAASTGLPLIATSYADWNRGRVFISTIIVAIRSVFDKARQYAPCVILIDELDSLPSRDIMTTEHSTGTHMIVNTLLEQLDGLSKREGIIVVATCNHPDRLDPALIRPGRLGKSIRIGLPGLDAIPQILAFHLKSDAPRMGDLKGIAVMCLGMTGAAIEQLVREARQHARRKRRPLQAADLVAIIQARSAGLSPEQQNVVAIHEAGHAVAAHKVLESTEIILSMVSSTESWGRVLTKPRAEVITRASITKQIVALLAGRAAEEIMIGEISAGAGGSAESDLAIASEMALRAVTLLGLSNSGSAFWHGPFRNLGVHNVPAALMTEARELVQHAYEEAKRLIEEHEDLVFAVAEDLLEKRALSYEAFLELERRHVTQPRFVADAFAWSRRKPQYKPSSTPPLAVRPSLTNRRA